METTFCRTNYVRHPIDTFDTDKVTYFSSQSGILEKAAGMENDPYFIGTAVWGWSERMIWPPGGETEFFPNVPQADVVSYLQANMPVPAAALAAGETR